MAVNFDANSGNGFVAYCSLGSAILSSPPMTFVCRVNPAEVGRDSVLIAIERSPAQGFADFEYYSLEIRGSGSDNYAQATETGPGFSGGTAHTATSSVTWSDWNNCVAMFNSHSSRTVMVNSRASAVTDTTSSGTPTVGETYFGARVNNSGTFRSMNGCMADAAILDFIPADDELDLYFAWEKPLNIWPTAKLIAPFATAATVTANLIGSALTAHDGGSGITTCLTSPPNYSPTPPPTPPTVLYRVPAVIGCPYTSRAQLLRPDFGNDAGAQAGPAFAKKRRLSEYGAYLFRTRNISFGTGFNTGDQRTASLTPVDGGPEIGNTELLTGIISGERPNDDYSWEGQLAWEQDRPTPGTILAVTGFIETTDK